MALTLPGSDQLAMLDHAARTALAAASEPFALTAGAMLFRQGAKADALYIVTHGRLEIATRIPGDETTMVSAIAPGQLVGEFALLDDGLRSANVRAVEPTQGLRIARLRFLACLTDGQPWALALIDAIRLLVASRTRTTIDRIVQSAHYDLSCLRQPGAGSELTHTEIADLSQHLMACPRLRGLADNAADLASAGHALQAPKGTVITDSGEPFDKMLVDRLLIVLRGAVRSAIPRPDGLEQLAIHGPGECLGIVALFNGMRQPLRLEAAEDTLLYAVDRPQFDRLRQTQSPLALALMEEIGRQLVRDQLRANRHMGRIAAQASFNAAGGGTHV